MPDIDPLDLVLPERYGLKGSPHDAWTTLRHESPVRWFEPEGFSPFWAITKHADIMEISGQPEIFGNAQGITLLTTELYEKWLAEGYHGMNGMRTIIEMDPPEHRDFRKLSSGFFTPRSIDRLDEIVDESAKTLIDSLGREGEGDFVELVAQRHPLRVLATILGVDRDDEERMLELTQQLFAPDDPDLQREGEDRMEASQALAAEFFQLFHRIVMDRRANPKDDLATLLATAKLANGEGMGDLETFGYYLIVFTAGHDTTRNAISGGLRAFLDNPDQLAKLGKDPSLAKSAVEEVVRWTSPVNYMRRTALCDTELRGQKIRKGDFLIQFYGSANRDEDVFDDPFAFRIDRKPNRHLGFGTGEHFCLGSHVARKSSNALFRELARRAEVFELAGDDTRIQANFVIGQKTLPVRWRFRS